MYSFIVLVFDQHTMRHEACVDTDGSEQTQQDVEGDPACLAVILSDVVALLNCFGLGISCDIILREE